nr:M20/M25/M40 family metallo-hydrolase [Liquorilactobacillus satsumensis]
MLLPPQNGSDPIVALGAQINALQTISSRNTDPFAAVVLSITHVAAGNTWNILPAESFFEGTVRTADPVVRTQVKKRFFEIVKYTAKAYGVTAEIDWYAGDPSVNNDPHLVSVLAKALNNSATIYPQEKRLGSDDFACYQAKIPGVYINIGNNEKISAHNSQFLADDKIVLQGAIFSKKQRLVFWQTHSKANLAKLKITKHHLLKSHGIRIGFAKITQPENLWRFMVALF